MTYILKEIEDMKKQKKYRSPYFDQIRTNHKSYSKVFFAYIKNTRTLQFEVSA